MNRMNECFFVFFLIRYWKKKCYIDKQPTPELDPIKVAGGTNIKFGCSCWSAAAGFCLSQPSHYGGGRKTTRNWMERVRQKVRQHSKHLISFLQINTGQKWWLIYKSCPSFLLLCCSWTAETKHVCKRDPVRTERTEEGGKDRKIPRWDNTSAAGPQYDIFCNILQKKTNINLEKGAVGLYWTTTELWTFKLVP